MHPEVEMSDPSEDADSLNKISAPSESDRAAEDKLPESDTNDQELGGLGPTPAIAGKEAVGANVEGDSRMEEEFDLVEVAKSSDAVEKSRELDGSKEAGGADVAEASGREDDGSSGSGEANRVEEEEEETKPLEKSPEHGGSSSPPATAGEEGDRADVAEVSGKEVSLEVSRREGEGMEVEKSNGSCQAVTVAVRSAVRPVSGEKKYAIQRSSCFHGVTKLKWSGKFEAHLWDNTSRMEGRKRKGKHVYLGTYDSEEEAARAHDLAALKYWGPTPNAKLNFPVSSFEKELETMKTMTQEEYVAHVRRQNSSFSRGSSSYRGVTRRRKGGKWQARIGRVGDKTDAKDIYLGTFDTEEEAAEAYDLAAIQLRGAHAVTNFDISNYYDEGLIPIEGACKQLAM